MNLPDGLLNDAWTALAWVLFLPLLVRAVWRAPWRMLADNGRLHVWLGSLVVLTLLWSLQAGVKPGLSLHLLGAMVLTLCFGWELAFIGLCVVLAATALNGTGGWEAYAANALLMGGVGVGASNLLYRLGRYVLPRHFFVYVFANGFFGAALAIMTVGLISSIVFAVQGAYTFDFLDRKSVV